MKIDFARIDLMGVDFVRIDLVGAPWAGGTFMWPAELKIPPVLEHFLACRM